MSTWLTAIVVDSVRIHLRRRPRQLHVSFDDRPDGDKSCSLLEFLSDRGPTSEDAPRRSVHRCDLMQLVRNLQPTLLTALQLRDFEGLPLQEIACIFGITVTAAKTRMSSARTRLPDLGRKLD